MKKLLFVLLSILVILATIIMEGGNIRVLLVPTSMFIIFFGVLFSTLFTYKFSEIVAVFRNAFIDKTVDEDECKTGIEIIRNIIRLTIYWSLTTVVLGLIFVLSNLSSINTLGKSAAIVCLALFYGFGAIAVLFAPMENSLQRKLNSIVKN